MSDELPKAISESVIKIGNCELRVYVLDDGRRIINAEDIENLFSNGTIIENDDDMKELVKFIQGEQA